MGCRGRWDRDREKAHWSRVRVRGGRPVTRRAHWGRDRVRGGMLEGDGEDVFHFDEDGVCLTLTQVPEAYSLPGRLVRDMGSHGGARNRAMFENLGRSQEGEG